MSSILECAMEGLCSCLYWCCMEVCCSERATVPEHRTMKPDVTELQPNGQPVFVDATGISTESPAPLDQNICQYDHRMYEIG